MLVFYHTEIPCPPLRCTKYLGTLGAAGFALLGGPGAARLASKGGNPLHAYLPEGSPELLQFDKK